MCNKLLDLDAKEKVDAKEEGKRLLHLHNSFYPIFKTAGVFVKT